MSITQFPQVAYHVISLLSTQELLSQKEITNQLNKAGQSDVKYAIRRLQENGVLQIQPNLLDMRSSTYRISTEDELQEAKEKLTSELYETVLDHIYGAQGTNHPLMTSSV